MVSNMEKHYVFKSLFEDNLTQVCSIGGKAHLCMLSDIVHESPLGAHFPVFVQFEGHQEASCPQWMQ
jgi:hypothetical protein